MFETEGKIFVVVAVLAIILIGLFVYLFLMEKRIKAMEKDLKKWSEKQEEIAIKKPTSLKTEEI